MKLVLWTVVLLLVVIWVFRNKKISASATSAGAAKSSQDTERMVQCVHCSVHIPASEAVFSPSGAAFCSQEHLLRHVKS